MTAHFYWDKSCVQISQRWTLYTPFGGHYLMDTIMVDTEQQLPLNLSTIKYVTMNQYHMSVQHIHIFTSFHIHMSTCAPVQYHMSTCSVHRVHLSTCQNIQFHISTSPNPNVHMSTCPVYHIHLPTCPHILCHRSTWSDPDMCDITRSVNDIVRYRPFWAIS